MKIDRFPIVTFVALALLIGACGDKEKNNDAALKNDTAASGATGTSASTTTATDSDDAELFTSEEGKFTIMVPEQYPTPSESVTPMNSPGGNVDLKMYTAESGESAVMFAFANMEGKIDMAGLEDKMLDGARDNTVKQMNATLISEEKIEINGNPGRKMIMSMPGGPEGKTMYGRFHVYMVKPIMYQVFYLSTDQASLETPSINSYFESFKLASS